MKISKKTLIYSLIAILVIIIGVIIFLYFKKTSYNGSIKTAVDSEVTIERDNKGMPYITANSINDAYFAVGFLHAQDRLPLIEYFRAAALGKLSGITGKDGLFMDKLSLTIGFARRAGIISEKLSDSDNKYIDSYIKGINAARKNLYNVRSFKGISKSDWTVKDVISILLLFEWSDAFLNNRELIFPVPVKLNLNLIKDFIPGTLLYEYQDYERSSVNLLLKIRNTLKEKIGGFGQGMAFHISADSMDDGKSVSGFLLDGDMSIYPRWYPLSVTVGDNKIEGVSASGLPFIFFGRNKDISFYGFNLDADTQYFYLERTSVINKIPYYYRGTWHKFNITDEELFLPDMKQKTAGKISVRSTDIGPVISDLSDKEDDYNCITINSLFPDESYIKALLSIPFIYSPDEAKKNVSNIRSLPKVYLFATSGNAVCAYSGNILLNNSKSILNDGNIYTGDYPVYLSTYLINKITDNIIIGNNVYENEPAVINDYIFYKNNDRYNTFKRLTQKEDYLTEKDIISALTDTKSSKAEKFTPLFLTILERIPLPSATLSKIYFNNWNYNMDPDSVAATIFNTLLINMLEETLNDDMGSSAPLIADNFNYLTDNYYNIVSTSKSELFDDKATKDIENRDNIFDRAFIRTLRYLNRRCGPIMEDWKWGSLHKGCFNLPRGMNYFFNNRDGAVEIPFPGGGSTIINGTFSASDLLKPETISLVSGIFFLDSKVTKLSFVGSHSLDPDSEYFGKYGKLTSFENIDELEMVYLYTILPFTK